MTRDHAAALAKLDAGATIPHDLANALYRAGARVRMAKDRLGTGHPEDWHDAEQEYGQALKAFDAALAAVADKITKGEGK